jgi:hypothetical protein
MHAPICTAVVGNEVGRVRSPMDGDADTFMVLAEDGEKVDVADEG